MDIEQEFKRLQGIERGYLEYLKVQCESVGASTDVEGLENPKLALACRYALANREISLRDHFAASFGQALATSFEYGATLQRLFDPDRAISDSGNPNEKPQNYLARVAYTLADAMLEERSKAWGATGGD